MPSEGIVGGPRVVIAHMIADRMRTPPQSNTTKTMTSQAHTIELILWAVCLCADPYCTTVVGIEFIPSPFYVLIR